MSGGGGDAHPARPAIVWVEQTTSTNDEVRERASRGAPHGTAVVAAHQTAGRGRLGRRWLAEPGAALLMSVLVRRQIPGARAPLLCLAAAVAVAEAAGPAYRIKWPNDVLAPDRRKVAGILAEADAAEGWQILGVGLNLTGAPALPEATSLHETDDRARDRRALAHAVIDGLLSLVEDVQARPARVLERWRARAITLGRRVRVGRVEGVALDVDPDGALCVLPDDGRPTRILAGDVEMVRGYR